MTLHNRAGCLTIALYCTRLVNETIFQANRTRICARPVHHGCLHSRITMWTLAVFLLGLPHAIQTVTHLYSASGWSCLNYYTVPIFLPYCKSGLDCAWHCTLPWLRHGLHESNIKKCRQEPLENVHVLHACICAFKEFASVTNLTPVTRRRDRALSNRVQRIKLKPSLCNAVVITWMLFHTLSSDISSSVSSRCLLWLNKPLWQQCNTA